MKALHVLILAAALAGCAPAVAMPDPSEAIGIAPIQIDQVEVEIRESFPPQVAAHIIGTIGDGCSYLHAVKQTRDGNTITLSIERARRSADICTLIARLYDETIRLEGEFPAGNYTLIVNDVETAFRID